MKKVILSSIILILTTIIYGQEIKISVTPTINNAQYFRSLDGAPGHNPKLGFNGTIEYLICSDKKFSFGVDISYQYSKVGISPAIDPVNNPPDFSESLNLLSMSLSSILNLRKEFYLRISPTLALQTNYNSEKSIDNQTGIGLSCGFGKRIKIKEADFFFLEPRIWIHNIIPFNDDKYPLRIVTAGLNIGLVFGLKRESQPSDKEISN